MVCEAFCKLLDEILEEVRSGVVNYSSIVAESILLPINTLQLHQQLHDQSTVHSLRRLLSERGFFGMYHGLIGRIIQSIASTWGFFVSQTILRSLFSGKCSPSQLQLSNRSSSQLQLTNRSSLIVDMLAQQLTSLFTNPFDVVASVTQLDVGSKGFSATFIQLLMLGNWGVFWRGLNATLMLSTIPALVASMLETLSKWIIIRTGEAPLSGRQIFCMIGVMKALVILLIHPLIRARSLIHIQGGSFRKTLSLVVKSGGICSLYTGIGTMICKTVLFNAMVMGLVKSVTALLQQKNLVANRPGRMRIIDGQFRKQVRVVNGFENPWDAAAGGAIVGYADGCWSCLHMARNEHLLRELALRVDHLIIGIHCDWCLRAVIGRMPPDKYDARLRRLLTHRKVTSVLEGAPWVVSKDMISQLGISKVFSSAERKDEVLLRIVPSSDSLFSLNSECSSACFTITGLGSESEDEGSLSRDWSGQLDHSALGDPYAVCKRFGIFEELPVMDSKAREVAWLREVSTLLFSSPNAPASKCWDIVSGSNEQVFMKNPIRRATKLARQWVV